MKIEVGKYYRTRDGEKVGPMRNGDGIDGFDWDAGGDYGTCQFYSDTGKADDGHEFDLIAEWTDTPEVGTLREIGAQVGDVVDKDGSLYFVCDGPNHYGQDGLWASGCKGGKLGNKWTSAKSGFRIISRASDTKPAGPVITETVTTKRIVPGVYGRVRVNWCDGDKVCFQLRGDHWAAAVIFSRADLISARDILNQLIDAMEDQH